MVIERNTNEFSMACGCLCSTAIVPLSSSADLPADWLQLLEALCNSVQTNERLLSRLVLILD
ncbi:hypothetical protein D3C84_1175570 [compost metagenome]